MAVLRPLRASVGQHRRSGPAGPPPPRPDKGASTHTGPPKGKAPSCGCSPPTPRVPADTVDPLPSPWDAPCDGGCSIAAPPCAPCMTCMLGPCAHRKGFAWGAVGQGCP